MVLALYYKIVEHGTCTSCILYSGTAFILGCMLYIRTVCVHISPSLYTVSYLTSVHETVFLSNSPLYCSRDDLLQDLLFITTCHTRI